MSLLDSILPSAVQAIGNTPLVELGRVCKNAPGRILAKLEYLNPGFSKKDRIARQIIEDALAAGELAEGQTVLEITSGNTGTGLSIVCGVMGIPFVAVMSAGNSPERARMMRALGAEVVLVDQLPESVPGQVSGGDLDLAMREGRRLAQERGAFVANQFEREAARRAHYLYTAPEMIRQSGGIISGFCDFVGTATTFAGCAAAFKEHNPATLCFVVEPAGAAVLAGNPAHAPEHRIQGGGYSMPHLPLLNREHCDGFLSVSDEEAMACARRLAAEEGIFAGFSSGANLAAALKLLEGPCRNGVVAITINDSGLKYLSTDLWE